MVLNVTIQVWDITLFRALLISPSSLLLAFPTAFAVYVCISVEQRSDVTPGTSALYRAVSRSHPVPKRSLVPPHPTLRGYILPD